MKLKSLESFEVLNKETINIITGGITDDAYDCSRKNDTDSEHHD